MKRSACCRLSRVAPLCPRRPHSPARWSSGSSASTATTPAGGDKAHQHSYHAVVVHADRQGNLHSNDVVVVSSPSELVNQDPASAVTVRVRYSNLNYKDGMIVQGRSGVVSRFPIVPGIDAAGTVIETSSKSVNVGDEVVVTGNKIGQHFDGGFSQLLRVKAEWLLPLPRAFTLKESMMIGSAGVTAMQCIMHLEEHAGLDPTKGEVLVTGAAGGLGSIAVAILSKLGYSVCASSGRAEALEGYFKALGAARVIGRLEHNPKRPLGAQLWAGAVDSVGGETLAAVLSQTKYRCGVASTGVAGGGELNTSVYPLILRGIRLLGVDSTLPYNVEGYPEEGNETWLDERRRIWARLEQDLDHEKLHLINQRTIGLSEVQEWSKIILAGGVQGRIVVDVDR